MAPEQSFLTQQLAATVLARCEELGRCTDEPGVITRAYGGPGLEAAMQMTNRWMQDAGLSTRRDAIGNLIGRYAAEIPGAPVLLIGSHLDSVRNAGRYDGPLGVLLGIAVIDELRARGEHLPITIDVVAFADEEGLRFHTTYLGSRVLACQFPDALWGRTDGNGVTLREACLASGGDPDRISSAAIGPDVIGYLEAHIEQGPALEHAGLSLGVVSSIAGQSRISIAIHGMSGHAGTVAMELRHDALAVAAAIVTEAERFAAATDRLLATVGMLEVVRGASNVIPGEVRLTLDVRSDDDQTRTSAVDHLHRHACACADAHGVNIDWTVVQENDATPMDVGMVGALTMAASRRGVATMPMVSGAGHDAVMMATVCPVGMLFLRCPGGISHHPDEAVVAEDIPRAIDVLTDAVMLMAKDRL